MEYGLIPKIDQYADNKSLEIKKVESSKKASEIGQKEQLDKLKQEAIEKNKEVSQAKKIGTSKQNSTYEVVLSNLNFGFNDESKDFYVKVSRGNVENQYPTEQMMKMKAYMMSLTAL